MTTGQDCDSTDGARRIALAVHDHLKMDESTKEAAFGVAVYTVAQLLHCNIKTASLMVQQWLTCREQCDRQS